MMTAKLKIVLDRENHGRWIAEAVDRPGVLAFGAARKQAQARAEAPASQVTAEKAARR